MTPMLEKVARAIAQESGLKSKLASAAYIPHARAALLALRDLDTNTVLAGQATGNQYEGCDPEESWTAMIDAILKG